MENEQAQLDDKVNVPIKAIQIIDSAVIASKTTQHTHIREPNANSRQSFPRGPTRYILRHMDPASGLAPLGSKLNVEALKEQFS